MGCTHATGRVNAVNYCTSPATKSEKAKSRFKSGAISESASTSRGLAAASGSTADPALGLNERELYKLKTSWRAVHRTVKETGIEMFISLFKINSDLQMMFQRLNNLELNDSIRESEEMAAHGELVMGLLDDAITNIECKHSTREKLRRAAATHKRLPGFYGKLFWAMEQPFMEAVRITLGDRFNQSIEDIYIITIHYILGQMEEGFNEAMS